MKLVGIMPEMKNKQKQYKLILLIRTRPASVFCRGTVRPNNILLLRTDCGFNGGVSGEMKSNEWRNQSRRNRHFYHFM